MANTKEQIRQQEKFSVLFRERIIARIKRLLPIRPSWVLTGTLIFFLAFSACLISDYGMNVDSVKNYQEGRANLDYLLTGKTDQEVLRQQLHGAFFVMTAELSKRLFSDILSVSDPVAARQILLPLLTTVFLFFLFHFTRRYWGAWQGLVVVGLLLTFPYFWGETFNNQKDIPLLVFSSLSLMSFYDWMMTGKRRYLYGFFACLGFAMAIKLQALLVPVLLLVWYMIAPRSRWRKGGSLRQAGFIHVSAGIMLTATIFLGFYAPLFWGVEDKLSVLISWQNHAQSITTAWDKPFNLTSLVQIFYRTPVLFLIFGLSGIVFAIRYYKDDPLYSLLLVWLTVPVAFPCFPGTVHYSSGLRLYLLFLVPWAFMVTIALFRIQDFAVKRTGIKGHLSTMVLTGLIMGFGVLGIVGTHPYQTTFFNRLAGGLKGAQEMRLPDACDERLTSYGEAGRWIKRNAGPQAHVLALGTMQLDYVKACIGRPDLAINVGLTLPGFVNPNTYVIYVPRDFIRSQGLVLSMSGDFQTVLTISRQKGEIMTIYYKPWPGIPLLNGTPERSSF